MRTRPALHEDEAEAAECYEAEAENFGLETRLASMNYIPNDMKLNTT